MSFFNGKKKGVFLLFLILSLSTLLFLASCASDEQAWEDAVEENTIESYKEYLEEFINQLHEFQLMASGEECPSTGTITQIYGEEKDTVMLYHVVPKDVSNFNLYADDYLPINFTPEEEIKDEIKAETDL